MEDLPVDSTVYKDKRRWWVALLMLFPTGAGYIYVGRPLRFLGFMAFVLLAMLAWHGDIATGMNQLYVFPILVVLVVAVFLGFAIDIVSIARNQNSHNMRWPQRRKWYVASLAIWTALAIAPAALGT